MTEPISEAEPKHTATRLIVLILFLILISAGYYWYRILSPAQQYQRAVRIAAFRPKEAEALLESAILQSPEERPDWQYLRVKLLIQLDRWDEALGQWSLITDPARLPADDLCQVAFAAQQFGQLTFAQDLFQAASHNQQLLPKILRSLIQIHLQMGQEDLALQECKQLLEIAPQDSTAWQVLGTVYLTRKEISEAEQALRQCLLFSRNPQQVVNVREDLIQVLIDSGQLEKAKEEWHQLQAISPLLSERAVLEYAWILRTEGKSEEGLKLLADQLGRQGPISEKAILMRGMLLTDSSKFDQAVEDLKNVVGKQPWNKEAHQQLSVVYTRLKQPELAEQHRTIAEELNNDSLTLLKLNAEIRQKPGDMQLRQQIAELYRKLGKPDQAARILSIQNPDEVRPE
ncbi:MAG: hypothetical protein KDA78_02860 [Planctomycetaceae bacterium]|nr:hypothetical protein [Planctomycetaceae bacterium]